MTLTPLFAFIKNGRARGIPYATAAPLRRRCELVSVAAEPGARHHGRSQEGAMAYPGVSPLLDALRSQREYRKPSADSLGFAGLMLSF